VADERKREERQRSEKYLETQFDTLKHLTTLDSAIAVVVLAVYQAGALSGGGVVFSLAFFGASLVIALASMYRIMLNLRYGLLSDRTPWGVILSGGYFFVGLTTFAYITLTGG
jgi:hypothetical protein